MTSITCPLVIPQYWQNDISITIGLDSGKILLVYSERFLDIQLNTEY